MVTVKVGLQKASAYQQVLAGTHQYGPSQRHRSVPLPPVWIQHLCSTGILWTPMPRQWGYNSSSRRRWCQTRVTIPGLWQESPTGHGFLPGPVLDLPYPVPAIAHDDYLHMQNSPVPGHVQEETQGQADKVWDPRSPASLLPPPAGQTPGPAIPLSGDGLPQELLLQAADVWSPELCPPQDQALPV